MKVRKLTREEVTFTLSIEEEDHPMDFESDDPEKDEENKQELRERLDRGDIWAWCTVTVEARWKDIAGGTNLGGCSYEDEEDFRKDQYFEQLQEDALENLNNAITRMVHQVEPLIEKTPVLDRPL